VGLGSQTTATRRVSTPTSPSRYPPSAFLPHPGALSRLTAVLVQCVASAVMGGRSEADTAAFQAYIQPLLAGMVHDDKPEDEVDAASAALFGRVLGAGGGESMHDVLARHTVFHPVPAGPKL